MMHRKIIDKYLKLSLNFNRLKLTFFISNEKYYIEKIGVSWIKIWTL